MGMKRKVQYLDVHTIKCGVDDKTGPSMEDLEREFFGGHPPELINQIKRGKTVIELSGSDLEELKGLAQHLYEKYLDYGCGEGYAARESNLLVGVIINPGGRPGVKKLPS